MADNLPVTPGVGASLATDDIAGVHYPYNKLAFGSDGVATLVSSSNPLPTQDTPVTSGGLSTQRFSDVDETEETIKNSAGQLYALELTNESGSTAYYVHLYDAASPDTAADTPKLTFKLAANTTRFVEFTKGVPFTTAITVGALTTFAPGASGPGANEVRVNAFYK